MLHPLIIVIALALIYWIFHIRRRGAFKKYSPPQRLERQISGHEVRTYLDIDTPLECLRDDGVRFGESFRLKEGPSLPHSETCKCQLSPISYSSTEVFDGAINENSSRHTSLGELNQRDAMVFKKALITFHTTSSNLSTESFLKNLELENLSQSYYSQALKLFETTLEIPIPSNTSEAKDSTT